MTNLDCVEAFNIGTNKRHSRNQVAVALNILFLHLQLAKWPAVLEEMKNERDFFITMLFFHTGKLQFGANIFYNFGVDW